MGITGGGQIRRMTEVSGYKGKRLRITDVGSLEDTLKTIQAVTRESIPQSQRLARRLKKKTLRASAKAIYTYIVRRIAYKLDRQGVEEIRTAARTLADRKSGVDCEDYSILIASLLINMGYDAVYEVVDLNRVPGYDHIFTVGRDKDGTEVIIDPTPHPIHGPVPFDTRPQGIRKTMVIDVLSGSGTQRGTYDAIYGLGAISTPSQQTQMLMDRQSQLLRASRMASPAERKKMGRSLRKLRYLILLNNTPEQQMALDLWEAIVDIDKGGNVLWHPSAVSEVEEYLTISEAVEASPLADPDMDQLQGYGIGFLRRNPKKKAARQAKQEAKQKARAKAKQSGSRGSGIRKAGHLFNKLNPTTVAARNAFLLAMKQNVLNLAETLKWGYLSENEAKQRGFDISQWRKIKTVRERAERSFYTLGGKPENLRKAILQGSGGLSGLGALPIAAIPAVVKAASKFLKPLAEWIKRNVKLDKLFKKVDQGKELFQKLQKGAQAAEKEFKQVEKTADKLSIESPLNAGVNTPDEQADLDDLVGEGAKGSGLPTWVWITGIGLVAVTGIFVVPKLSK